MKSVKPIPAYLWLIVALPFVYLAHRYPGLPDIIPIHYDGSGAADKWAAKATLWILPFALPLLNLFIMTRFIPTFDLRNSVEKMGEKYEYLTAGVVSFMSLISCYLIYEAGNEQLGHLDLLYIFLGLLIAFFGNFFPTIRPNHFIGIRTPWTLGDDENWRKTHRFGGRVWFAGGAMLALVGLLKPTVEITEFFFVILLLICLLPIGYSYWVHHNQAPDEFV